MSFRDYLDIFSRRKWPILACFAAIWIGAGLYCILASSLYRSTATVVIVPPRVMEGTVRPPGNGKRIQERLEGIRRQVESRTRLKMIMEEIGLFPAERKKGRVEDAVAMMRERVEVRIAGVKDRDADAFTLSFTHEDPATAMRTVERMVAFFVDEDLREREQLAVGTSEFLDAQLRETRSRLEEQEAKILAFRKKNIGELPQQFDTGLASLDRLKERLDENIVATRMAEERAGSLAARIRHLERGGAREDIEAELADRHAQLSDLSARYTDRYPAVVRLRREIEQLEKRLASPRHGAGFAASAVRGDAGEGGPKGRPASRSLEEIRVLRGQLASARAEAEGLKKGGEAIRQGIAEARTRLARMPERERELLALARENPNVVRKYDDLLAKKLDADVSLSLERRQQGERFDVIDPPNLPEKPVRPDRPRIMGAAFLLACFLGFGTALLLEMLDPALQGEEDYKRFFALPLLATVVLNPAMAPPQRSLPFRRKERQQETEVPALFREERQDPFLMEQFLPLQTRIEHRLHTRRCRVMAITSAIPGEGKTVTCAGLSMNLAAAGWKKVLLIDADLYKPDAARGLAVGPGPGLAEYLAGTAELVEILRPGPVPGLTVLPAGTRPENPAGLLAGERFRSLLHEMRSRYDVVLLDTPPVLSAPDTLSLRGHADGFVFVYRAGITPYTLLLKAVEEVGENEVLGVVLNGVEQQAQPYYHHYYTRCYHQDAPGAAHS